MGVIDKLVYEKIVNERPDRSCNLVRVYKAPNGEVTIHFRNLKIVLHNEEEIREWKEAFTVGLKDLGEYFSNDI